MENFPSNLYISILILFMNETSDLDELFVEAVEA